MAQVVNRYSRQPIHDVNNLYSSVNQVFVYLSVSLTAVLSESSGYQSHSITPSLFHFNFYITSNNK